MKTKALCTFLVAVLTGFSSLFAQGFLPPSQGKAVVYFARVSSMGGIISFEFFHQDKYIGVFKWKNYLRYECDPGEQLLWASSENKEFVTADLKEGGTYVVICDIIMGMWKPHVGLAPITAADDRFQRAKELINSEPSVVMAKEKIDAMNVKLASFIQVQLKKYNEEWKGTRNFKHISADMAIPAEAMK